MTPKNLYSLEDYLDKAEDTEGAAFWMQGRGAVPPKALENLRKLQRLNMLTGDVLLSLIGQAPIDPWGIFGALQSYGPWAFQPIDFTAINILAKKGDKPVALMRVDLLSDDITFVVLKDKQLVQHAVLSGEEIMRRMSTPGLKPAEFTAWLRGQMQAAVDAGMKGA